MNYGKWRQMNVRNDREHHFTVYMLVNCFELFDFDSIHCRRTIKRAMKAQEADKVASSAG